MALIDIPLPHDDETAVPGDVAALLAEADRRIDDFQRHARVPGFVASDYPRVYRALRSLTSANLTTGNLFCEWGSGFGVVACLATMLGYDAVGVEIEPDLVDCARNLADDFDVPAKFVQGSYIPKGAETLADIRGTLAWLVAEKTGTNLGLDMDDFDVIFACPWPDERGVTERLFERYAGSHTLLMTHHIDGPIRLRRKRGKKPRRRFE
ncbi:MAG: class I SAM-dependent methyltransferase [Planctomycetes bacterium]|nr:class I SAM-dependent methyltransferase [Planctomycetota bacterium]